MSVFLTLPGFAEAGQAATISVGIQNNGSIAAENVVTTITLPAQLQLVSTTNCAEDPSGVPTCTLVGDLAAGGGFVQVTLQTMLDAGTTGNLSVQVAVTSDTTEQVPNNNSTTRSFLAIDPGPLPAAPGGVGDGLAAWWRADMGVTEEEGGVAAWLDQSGNGRHASQQFAFNRPTVSAPVAPSALNGLPTLRFSSGQFNRLDYDGAFLGNSSYTVFAVEGRDRDGLANFFMGGTVATNNRNLLIGYENVTTLRQAHFGNDLDGVVPEHTGTQQFALSSFTFDMDVGREIHRSGSPAGFGCFADSPAGLLRCFDWVISSFRFLL